MKRTCVLIVLSTIMVVTGGCKQKTEEKSEVTYSQPTAPAAVPTVEIDMLQREAKMHPKSKDAWTNLGNALMDSQRFSEAIDAYQKSLALDPKNVDVRVDMGTCYRGVGKFDKAVEEYRKALAIDPKFPNGHRNLAVVLANDLRQNKQAIQEFQKYLELVPNAPDAAVIRQTIQQLQMMPAGK